VRRRELKERAPVRTLNISAAFLALASAFLVYGLNYDTRRLAGEVANAERAAERTRSEIAVLRAERAHLSRPERIEPLARAQGLQPVAGSQLAVALDDLDAKPAR
jgi:cell division protein FtsL